MKFGVLVFPGSNCDHDTYNVIAEIAHQPGLLTAITLAPAPLRIFRR